MYPTHDARGDRNLPLHPGINFSRMEVGGDLGGFVFMVGSTIAVLLGLPPLAWFLSGALLAGLGVAGALLAWHTRHQHC